MSRNISIFKKSVITLLQCISYFVIAETLKTKVFGTKNEDGKVGFDLTSSDPSTQYFESSCQLFVKTDVFRASLYANIGPYKMVDSNSSVWSSLIFKAKNLFKIVDTNLKQGNGVVISLKP